MMVAFMMPDCRRLVVRAMLCGIAAATTAAAQQPARPTLTFDSVDVRRLLSDAVTAALKAPAEQRLSLLAAAARIQVDAADFESAERTVALAGEPEPSDVLRQLGKWEWMSIIDRAGPARRLVCGLRAAGRPGDALAVVRRMAPGPRRDWLLGHEAMLTMQPPHSPAATPQRALSEVTRARAALDIIHDIALPEARLDALLMVMGSVSDTGSGVSALRELYAEARAIRVSDRDRQASRDALIAGQALRAGRPGDVPELFGGLSDPEDLEIVLDAATDSRGDSRLARSLASRVIAAGRAIADSAARRTYLAGVHASLQRGVDREFADRLVPEARVDTAQARADRERTARADAQLAATYPEDVAKQALLRGDYAEIRRQLDRVPLGVTGAHLAAVSAELAWGAYVSQRDSALALLNLGVAALHRAGPLTAGDSAEYDRAAARTALIYFWLGDVRRGIETVSRIRDPDEASDALRDWGASSFQRPFADSIRMFVNRISDARLRDAALARFVEIELVPVDIRRARALADSIGTPGPRADARRAVGNAFLRRRDTTTAKLVFMTLLSDSSLAGSALGQQVIPALVAVNAWREADAWARSATRDHAERARRLMAVASSLNAQLLMRREGYSMSMGNGPDACLDVF